MNHLRYFSSLTIMHLYENTPSMEKYPPLRIQTVKEGLTAFPLPSKKKT
jgi:hypothetical protein